MKIVDKSITDLENFKEKLCKMLEKHLTKAIQTVQSVPDPKDTEALDIFSLDVEEENKVSVEDLRKEIEFEKLNVKDLQKEIE